MKAIADEVGLLRLASNVSWRDAAEPEQDGAQLPALSVHDRDGAAVVSLRGELDCSDVSALHACLTDIRCQERARCVTDLSELAFLDCACLSVLVGHCKRVRGRGDSFALAGPQRAVRKLLSATRLLTWFDVYDTVEEAIAGGRLSYRSPAFLSVTSGP